MIDTDPLARSLDGALENFGVPGQTSLPGADIGLGFTLGVRLSYRLGLRLETVHNLGGDGLVTNYFGGLATVVLTPERSHSCSLGVGAGIGRQRIATHQYYDIQLSPDAILEEISYESAWQTVVPLAVVLELPNHRYSRYAFVATLRQVLGDVQSGPITTGYGGVESVPFEVDFGGWILTLGLTVGL